MLTCTCTVVGLVVVPESLRSGVVPGGPVRPSEGPLLQPIVTSQPGVGRAAGQRVDDRVFCRGGDRGELGAVTAGTGLPGRLPADLNTRSVSQSCGVPHLLSKQFVAGGPRVTPSSPTPPSTDNSSCLVRPASLIGFECAFLDSFIPFITYYAIH